MPTLWSCVLYYRGNPCELYYKGDCHKFLEFHTSTEGASAWGVTGRLPRFPGIPHFQRGCKRVGCNQQTSTISWNSTLPEGVPGGMSEFHDFLEFHTSRGGASAICCGMSKFHDFLEFHTSRGGASRHMLWNLLTSMYTWNTIFIGGPISNQKQVDCDN